MFIAFLAVGCGAEGARDVSGVGSCKVTLPPATPRETAPADVSAEASGAVPSRAIVDVEIPFARIARELEPTVPTRVAEERGRDIGVAGYLDTTVDRGPFELAPSPSGHELLVRTRLRAMARACTSGRGCYASCAPEAIAEVTVSPTLGHDYALRPPKLAVRLVRGCKIAALGGLLSIDVTPTIEAQLGPRIAQVEREIAARLPDVRPKVEAAYHELAKPRDLPLGLGCALLHPHGFVQGPIRVEPGLVRARIALLVAPEIVPRCPTAPAVVVLPNLASDPSLPASEDIAVTERVPFDRFVGDRGAAASHPRAVVVRGSGAEVLLRATLVGETCGETDARAALGTSADGSLVTLGRIVVSDEEASRIRAAHGLVDDVRAALDGTVHAPLALSPGRIRAALPALLPALSTSDVTTTGEVENVGLPEVRPTPDHALATTRVRLRATAKVSP